MLLIVYKFLLTFGWVIFFWFFNWINLVCSRKHNLYKKDTPDS